MHYKEAAKRLAALEAEAYPVVEELTPEEQTAANWAECARHLESYLSHRRAHAMLADEGRDSWAWHQSRSMLTYGRRDDDLVLRLVQHAAVIEYDPDAPYVAPVLALLPEVRHFLEIDGRLKHEQS